MHTNKYKHKIQIQLQLQLQIQISDDGLRHTILWAGQAAVDRGNHQSTQTEKDLHIFQIWREEHVTCYCFWYWQIDIGQEKAEVFVYVKPWYQSKIAFLFWLQDIWNGVMTWFRNYAWLGWFSDQVPIKMKACQNLPKAGFHLQVQTLNSLGESPLGRLDLFRTAWKLWENCPRQAANSASGAAAKNGVCPTFMEFTQHL